MACKLKLCTIPKLIEVVNYLRHELSVHSFCSFIDTSVNYTLSFLDKDDKFVQQLVLPPRLILLKRRKR